MLGVATGTIKSRCARGRLKLSVLLKSLRTPA
jgi:RNA polymerase sigma-70 factor (ECF subfamily)